MIPNWANPEHGVIGEDASFMVQALLFAHRGYGRTSPNPMVGAIITRKGEMIGWGWHKRAGQPHAEIEAMLRVKDPELLRGATLYVTLEPCSTHGRTPPCTDAIIASGISRVVVAAVDPNPKHAGAGLKILRRAGIEVVEGVRRQDAENLNKVFNHWIVHRRPFVLLKAGMTLDGKIATNSGESKWITSETARNYAMRLRAGVDAIVVGVNTVIRDDPSLSLRKVPRFKIPEWKRLQRVILDPQGRLPLTARVLRDENAALTTVVLSDQAPIKTILAIEKNARVIVAPTRRPSQRQDHPHRVLNLHWLMHHLGANDVTSVLVEGGGETHAHFLAQKLVNRVYFIIAPLLISGRDAPKVVAGDDSFGAGEGLRLHSVNWQMLGPDLLLTGWLVEKPDEKICSAELSRKRAKSFA